MYTIQILAGGYKKRDDVLLSLQARIDNSQFIALLTASTGKFDRPVILVKPVRLRKPKPYCGNHPGECVINAQKKKIMTYMEWEDWIKFNKIVNSTLNRLHTHANVWSNPPDVKGKFWIRKDIHPRIRYDWSEVSDSMGRPIRHWNTGDESQF